MAICPFAVQKPLGWNAPPITPTAICLHSAVTPPGYDLQAQWLAGGPNGVACHFYIRGDGTIEQYLDTAVKANAQYEGNDHCISIESEGLDPDHVEWNSDELVAFERLIRWCCRQHGIPIQVCPSPTAPGIGWHCMWTPPGTWNHDGHTCPGAARVAQIPRLLADLQPLPPAPPGGEMAQTLNKLGYIEQFRSHPDGSVSHRYQNSSGWQYDPAFSAAKTVDPSCPMSASLNGSGAIVVFATIGGNDARRFQVFNADGSFKQWSDWTTVF